MSNQLDVSQTQVQHQTELFGLILLSCGIFILSLAAIFIRLSENEIGPYATIFNRFWIGSLTLIFWKIIMRVRHRFIHGFPMKAETYTRKDIGLGIACGVISASCLLSWAWSLTQTSIANSNLLHNLTPVFATLGGWLFFRNSFDNRFVIGLIFALGGTTIIGLGDLQISPDNLIGDAVAFLSAVFYGGSLLVREKFRDKFPVVTVLLWVCCVGSFVTLSVTLLTEDRLFPYSVNGWLTVIGLGLICQVIGQSILTYSLKKFSAGFVSLFLLLEPLMTAIFAWAIFSESLSLINGLAFVIVLIGIYFAKSGQGSQKVNAVLRDSGDINTI